MSEGLNLLLRNYPPVLHDKPGNTYLEYYTGGERHIMRLNAHKKRLSQREFAALVRRLTAQIRADSERLSAMERERIGDMLRTWCAEKTKELRPDTMRSYSSFSMIFGEWCRRRGLVYIDEVTRRGAALYMDYVYNERNGSVITRNNHMKMARAFFGWCRERGMELENPFSLIKKKREGDKRRILIPGDERRRIAEYLAGRDDAMLCVCRLVFTSLIRPKEIGLIRLRDVSFEDHCIVIPGANSKNHNTRHAAISPEIERYIAEVADGSPGDWFLFGRGRGVMRPGPVQAGTARFRKEWMKLRAALDLPKEMQLYSLRDSGIFYLLKSGVDALSVMQHADHHDLEITTRYANHADPNLIRTIRERGPEF